jgi:hypothetical protein
MGKMGIPVPAEIEGRIVAGTDVPDSGAVGWLA